jgi:hypothetical protein
LRDLFFPASVPAFAPLDGEGFILQEHGVSLAFARRFTGGEQWRRAIHLQATAWRQKAQVDGWLDLLQRLLFGE